MSETTYLDLWVRSEKLSSMHEINVFSLQAWDYLTIIPRARMGFESIAHEAEVRMGYWLRGHEGERNNCFSKIQLVGQKYRDKTTLASKMDSATIV